jgi:ferritin-like metal-binding protein YciE
MKTSMKSPSHTDLHDLFVDELKDILWAEKQLTKALPKMARTAQSDQLRTAFSDHHAETMGHIERLGEIFDSIGLTPRAVKCEAMQGLLEEGEGLMDDYSESPALDAALISAAQKVEHYEIATYGTLRAFARRLGNSRAERLLSQTLEEESRADQLLTKIAEAGANEVAVEATA